jgi:hypothetical protein
MSKHGPMHLNPRHPMWWGFPLAATGFLAAAAVFFAALAIGADPSAWPAALLMIPVTGLGAGFSYRMWKSVATHEKES